MKMIMNEIEDFLKYIYLEKKYSGNTLRAYKKDLHDFYQFINKNSLSNWTKLKKKHIHEYLYYLSVKKLSAKTVARKLASVKSLFNFLVKENVLENNITKSVTSPKLDKKLPVFLNKDQISLLLNLSDSSDYNELRNNLILEIFYSTGIRISELVKIKIVDINLVDNSINILGKGNKKRIVIIGNYAKKKLEDYLNYDDVEKSDYLFQKLRKSKNNYLSERTVFNIVKKYTAKVTRNEKISPHSLRHTFATHLLNNGADLMSVKELLGHKDLSSTQIYTHVNISELRKSFKKAHPHAK
jgi:site-specific recombinase XerD